MSLIRVIHDKENPYTVVNRYIADDSRLSYKAVGIWFYAFSRKEDWQFYLKDLINRHKDGKESVQAGLKELEECGYLYRHQKKDQKDGKFSGLDWVFFETPKTADEIQKMFPTNGFSVSRGNLLMENPPLTSNECLTSNKELFVANDPVGSPPDKIKIKTGQNSFEEVTQSEMFRLSLLKKKKWNTEEILYAWNVLEKYKGVVHNWFRFIEGTIEKHRNLEKSKRASTHKTRSPKQNSHNKGDESCHKTKISETNEKNNKNSIKSFNNASLETDLSERHYPHSGALLMKLLGRSPDGTPLPKAS